MNWNGKEWEDPPLPLHRKVLSGLRITGVIVGCLIGSLVLYGLVLTLMTGGAALVFSYADKIPGGGYVVMALIGAGMGYYAGRMHGSH
ncbi:MAG TPA: hypothetical protein VJI96_01710 [Candidatus Andersenbacteria bacterium]|nr:hypothetical protein [Candidatus Andersenbacteria bacterium]